MNPFHGMKELYRRIVKRPREDDVHEEIQAHLQIQIDENIEAGMQPDEARYAAHKKFGNVLLFNEMAEEIWRIAWLDSLCQDVRIAARVLAKNRTFAFAVILTLAVGIGATTAIYSVVHSVLYPQFPFADPERIVDVSSHFGSYDLAPSMPSFVDWREQSEVVQELTAYRRTSLIWIDQGDPELIGGIKTTASLFRLAGIQPKLGRTFDKDDERPGRASVVVLGHRFWQQRYGGIPEIIGRTVSIDNKPYTVIGVMPSGKGFPTDDIKYWIPWVIDEEFTHVAGGGFTVVGRLKSGISLQQAQTNLNLLETRLAQGQRLRSGYTVRLKALNDNITPLSRSTVWTLFGAVLFVLLVACVNVANLLMARSSVRAREIALRSAIGASRARIIRYLLTECALLSILGGIAGIVLAYSGVCLFVSLKSPQIPGPTEARLYPAVLLFALGSTVVTALLFGLLPSLHASKINIADVLKQSSGTSAHRDAKLKRDALVSIEMALALILLTGAGLMMNSFVKLQNVPLGFDPHNVIAFQVRVPGGERRPSPQRLIFVDELLRRLRELPGITATAASSVFPLDSSMMLTGGSIPGCAPGNDGVEPVGVTAGYFRTMSIPVIRGRTFAESDHHPVAILSRKAVQQLCPDQDTIGKSLFLGNQPTPFEIVGIVGDVRYISLQREFGPNVYISFGADSSFGAITFALKSSAGPQLLAPMLKNQVRAVAPTLPVKIETLNDLFEPHIATPRFYLGLFSFFALVAVLMAAVGLYGLVNYSVSQRTQEFGIRMSLGARAGSVLRMVVREGAIIILAGAILGLAGALFLTRFIRSFLFGVEPTDFLTIGIATISLIIIALAACLIPARRASRIAPSIALKYE